jgi:hypothetical protein
LLPRAAPAFAWRRGGQPNRPPAQPPFRFRRFGAVRPAPKPVAFPLGGRPQPGTNRPPRGQIWGLFFFPSTRNPRSATKHTHARLRSCCCCHRLPCTSGGSSASPTQHARWAATTAPDPPTHNRVAGFAASPPPRVVSPRDSGILQEATASRSPRISLLPASLQSAECLRLPQGQIRSARGFDHGIFCTELLITVSTSVPFQPHFFSALCVPALLKQHVCFSPN